MRQAPRPAHLCEWRVGNAIGAGVSSLAFPPGVPLKQGDVLRVVETGENILVTDVGPSFAAVTRGIGSVPPTTIPATATLRVVGNTGSPWSLNITNARSLPLSPPPRSTLGDWDSTREPELSIEPVYGWRTWSIEPGIFLGYQSRLSSVNQSYYWNPKGENVAQCMRWGADHAAPDANCRCGFYLTKRLETALENGPELAVAGVVRGWGRVVEHRDGWRVEKAQIVGLLPDPINLYSEEYPPIFVSARDYAVEQGWIDAI